MMNINRLKGRIVEQGMTIATLAGQIGVDKATLYRKMKADGRNMSIGDACKIAHILQLSPDDATAIFFGELSHDMRIEGADELENARI